MQREAIVLQNGNTAEGATGNGKGAASEAPVTLILPPKKGVGIGWAELWEYRELLYFLTWRDVKVRYKQTVLGASWAILQPLATMVLFTLIFGRLAKMPSDDIPYPLFSFAALVPWTFFSRAVTLASDSIVTNSNLVKKVYFPRLVIPISAVLSGVVDYLLAFVVFLAVLMPYYGLLPVWKALWVLPLTMICFASSLGVGLWFGAMNVQFRDIRYVTPFLMQAWMYLTPIVYPASLLSEPYRTLYGLNPMTGVVEGMRWALCGTKTDPTDAILLSAAVSFVLLLSGLVYFRRLEKSFADVV
ncbi:MAG: ABC transporter permease [Thermodesulfobacteriota bacterium]